MARDTIVDRFLRNGRVHADKPALYAKRGGGWEPVAWRTYVARAREFAGALLAEGYEPGDAVAILGENSPEWVYADVGAMMARAVAAGIYQTSTAEQAAYVAGHCEARVVVAEDDKQVDKLLAQRASLPKLARIVTVKGRAREDGLVVTFDDFLAKGRDRGADVDARVEAIREGDGATLIYTSGTTGPPKGALLSHDNLAWLSGTAIGMTHAGPEDVVVSYLPLSHIAEQMFTLHLAITAGYTVWFAEALEKLKEALLAARPTFFLAVPRVWEKFKGALEPKLAEATGIKRRIVDWSRGVGLEAGRHRLAHGAPTGVLGVKYAVANKLFFSKLAAQLGLDRLRVAVTGAAPVGKDVLEFFLSVGIPIYEVYGQTEGTGGGTFNRPEPGQTKLGTVGKPFPGVELKIAPDGEILLRGRNVFLGYFKDEDATRATVIDGWLHTGDVGEFDADGFLRITDRKKDLIITSGGKNVAPQNIESLLRGIDGIGQAVVIGDRRKYLTALLTIDAEKGPALARARGWPEDRAELAKHDAFRAHVQAGIDRVNAQLARYESVKKWSLLPNDFTLETGELTPTQKVKRKVVHEKYGSHIEGMYEGAEA